MPACVDLCPRLACSAADDAVALSRPVRQVQALASHGVRRAELREPVIADLDSLGSAHRSEGTFRRGLIYEGRQY